MIMKQFVFEKNVYFTKEDIQMANKVMKMMRDILSHQGNANRDHWEMPLYVC